MSKLSMIALVLVLTAGVLAGCGRSSGNMNATGASTQPSMTDLPSTPSTYPTDASTQATTTPTDGMMDPSDSLDPSMGGSGSMTDPAMRDAGAGRSMVK